MKNDKSLVEQKSLLAKLMAAENISVEHKKIPTAAFDVKNRVLYLPILKWKPGSDTYDLFCAHEVGHALWTPEDGWHSSVNKKGKGYKSFLNVVEDARIEKKIKRKFAGARKHMLKGYEELMNEDFFGLRKMGMDVNDLGLIDRINLYTKAGTNYGIEFSEEEREWVEKIMRTETFEDVVEVCDALYDYCKENESETDNSYGNFSDEFGEGDDFEMDDLDISLPSGKGDGSEEEESEKDKPGTSSSEGEGEGEGEDGKSDSSDSDSGLNSFEEEVKDAMDKMKEENESKSDESSSDESSSGMEGGVGNPFGNREDMVSEPRSLTDDNFREREEEFADMSENVSVPLYLTFPKINTKSIVIDYKKSLEEMNKYYAGMEGAVEEGYKLLKKFKSNNDKMISYMVKEFEMKKAADIHRRAYNSKKGTLDMNKIHAYKYSENLFQQITSFPEGKNHGMVMFIDWSGSMSPYMKETIEQLINLTMFCSKVQIPFEVYSFNDHYRDWKDEDNDAYWKQNERMPYNFTALGKKIADYKKNDIVVSSNFRLVNLFSSRMRKRELNDAYRNLLLIAECFNSRYMYYYSRNHVYGMPSNFSLGGTPLDDTIIAAKSVIEEFKMKSRAQIVNTVFLTDGQSNRSREYVGSDNVVHGFGRGDAVHIDDPATRMRIYPNDIKNPRDGMTSLLLLGLKKSLGINLLGFFLTSGGGKRVVSNLSWVINRYPTEEDVSYFRKNKFLIDTGTAYDELYVINVKGLEIDEVDHIGEVEVGSSKSELRKALKKNTKGKLQNRILLNAFVEKVA
ncbi:MAG: hypothetical protein QGH83_01545 [Candidatus Pacebacteria bacterium]|nr:hypothetical protein [Candidatus Paceibacterota bacterium]